MFDFKNGMLGVVIIALAIAGALFGSYLAGIETEQVEVTKYDYLADVSGLFEYDQSPQYIEFDPSTNYTGYYSNDSFSEGVYYFAEDQVDYNPSSNVNNYKIKLIPEDTGSGEDEDIDSIPGLTDPLPSVNHRIYLTNTYHKYELDDPTTVSLKGILDSLNLAESTNTVYFKSPAVIENDDMQSTGPYHKGDGLDVIFFSSKSMWVDAGVVSRQNLNLVTKEKMDELGPDIESDTYQPCYSAIVDLKSNSVTLCYDNECLQKGPTIMLDTVVVAYDGTTATINYHFDVGETFDYQAYNFRNEYLDPNTGVWLKDEE